MDIERDTYEDAHPDLDEVRLYWDKNTGSPKLPSVTTILKTREEDKSNLHSWQDRNDGEGDNAHHEHLFWYKRHRGTLAHFHALQTLDPDLEWSADEAGSLYELGHVDELEDADEHPEVHDATPREVLYSVLKSQDAVESWGEFYDRYEPYHSRDYYSEALLDQKDRDVDYFIDAFERVCDKLGITQERVIAVEQYLFEEEYGYAGQVDLVYEDPDGDVVVADLKTSSGCYSKHKLQGAAYAKAIERDDDIDVDEVDRLEVIRIHPDSGQFAVHTDDPNHAMHVSTYWRKSYDQLWDEFSDLAEQFTYNGE